MLRNWAALLAITGSLLVLISCSAAVDRPSYVMAGGDEPAEFLSGKRYQLGRVELTLTYDGSVATTGLTDESSLNRQFAAFIAREMQVQGVLSGKAELRLQIMLDYGRRDDAPPIALYRAQIYNGQTLVAEHLIGPVEQADILLQPVEANTLAERQQLAEIARGIVQQLRRVSQ